MPFRDLVERTQLAVTVLVDGEIVFANRASELLLGVAPGAALGRQVLELVVPSTARAGVERVAAVLGGRPHPGSFETTLLHSDGTLVQVESVADVVRVGARCGVSIISCDVTERARREAELAHLATHDALTGLPNRVLLLDRLEQAVARAGRTCAGVLVLFVDLDRFKVVNDTHGHAVGDDVLRQVADRLRGAVRDGDTVARLAGDEFVVCAELEDLALAEALQARVLAALDAPVAAGGSVVAIGASSGRVLLEDGDDPLRVLALADQRMYADKARRREAPRS